jgi:hypothetical protein
MLIGRHRMLALLLAPVLILTAASWGGVLYRCHESGELLRERCCDESTDRGLVLESAECCGVERIATDHPVFLQDGPPAPVVLPSHPVEPYALALPSPLAPHRRWMLPHDAGPPVLRRTCALLN